MTRDLPAGRDKVSLEPPARHMAEFRIFCRAVSLCLSTYRREMKFIE